MARKISLPSVNAASLKSWTFVVVAGLLLALIAIVDRGGLDETSPSADGSTGCQLEVAVDQLNLRAAATAESDLVEVLQRGARVDATSTVDGGFRQLEDGRWAAEQFLVPVPGSTCS
jgi:hypothetical protein